MIEKREEEWAELEARAGRLLEHAKEVEPRDAIRRYGSVVRLWHYPAFGPQQTWTILKPGRKCPAGSPDLVREITWDREVDSQRMADPVQGSSQGFHVQPTLRLREASLPDQPIRELLEIGSGLAIPALGVASPVGMDGEYFGLETYEVSPNVRLQWWCAGPTEWRHFTSWVAELRGFLTRCLDQMG